MKKGRHLCDPESRRIIGERIPLLSDEVSAEILCCWGFGLPFGRCGVLRIPWRFFNFVLLLGAGGCFSQFKQMRSTNNKCKLRSGYASDKLKRLEFTWW
jgi:hypothetical protein